MKDQIERAIDLVLEQDRDEFLDLLKARGVNYTVRPDGLVDVEGNISLSYLTLIKIPVKFGSVNGYFDCSNNQLTSLKGCPEEVRGGGFYCRDNQLTSLIGCPEEVGGEFICTDNPVDFTKKAIELAKQGKAPLGLPLSWVLMKQKEKEFREKS